MVMMNVWTVGLVVGAAFALGVGAALWVIDGVRRFLRRRRRARSKLPVPRPSRRRGRTHAGHPLWPLCLPIELVLPRRRERKEDDER